MSNKIGYYVPLELPKYCDECPFGVCDYSNPTNQDECFLMNHIDGEKMFAYSHGYVCNIDCKENGKYTKIMRAKYDEHIKRPRWCKLKKEQPND